MSEPDEEACFQCGQPATHLCDYIIGREKVGTVKPEGRPAYDYTSLDAEVFTCDRPLCRGCAIHVGTMFFCGKEGGMESDDRCAEHAESEMCTEVITREEAEARRLRSGFRVIS